MKSKKKVVTLALAAIIAVTAIAGASLAYFTDTKTAENVLTMGNVKITLDEADIDEYGHKKTDSEKRITDGLDYGKKAVYPGAVLDKDPTVHNVGDNGAYIRATVTVSDWKELAAVAYPELKETAYTADAYKSALSKLVGTLGQGWSVIKVNTKDASSDVDFVLKYDGILLSGADTTPIFSKVIVPTQITNETNTCINGITVSVEAIQENSFNSWEAAFTAYDAE